MKALKLYWIRFKSKTPKALKNIQKLLGMLLVPITSGLAIVNATEQPLLYKILQNAVVTVPLIIAFLQFATAEKSVQEMDQ